MHRAPWLLLLACLLAALPRLLAAQIGPMCAGSCVTYAVSVTPDGGFATATSGQTGRTMTFTVANTGSNNSSTYDLTVDCTAPVTDCTLSKDAMPLSAGSQDSVTVTYSVGWAGVGQITVTATDVEELHESFDTGSRNVTVTGKGRPVISAAPHAASARLVGACIAACFDAVYQRGGPAYVSMGIARGVSLVYNSSTHRPRPVVAVDVSKNAQTTALPNYYRLQVRRTTGQALRLANDSLFVYYTPASAGNTRLLAAIRADSTGGALPTGAYPVRVVVDAIYTGNGAVTYTDTLTTTLLVNNQRGSVYGAGVDLAGIPRVYATTGGALLTTGDGSMLFYAEACTGCDYKTPGGTSARLRWISASATYRLTALDSSFVEFNSTGRMVKAADRFGNRDSLVYGGVGDTLLRAIIDPMGKRDSLCYGSGCGTSGKLTEIRSLGGTAGSRTMGVLHDAQGRLVRFTDPDGLKDSLAYNSDSLLAGIVNRGGNRTDFRYDALFRLDTIQAPSVTLHDGSSGRPTVGLNAAERVAWQPSVAGTSTGTAKPGLWVDTVTATIVGPLGATTRYRLDRFGAPTRVTDPFGVYSTFVRDTAGRVVQSADPQGRTVSYTYNGHAVSRIVDQGGSVTRTIDFSYDFSNYNLRTISGDVVRQDFHYYAADTVGGRRGALKQVYVGNEAATSSYPALTNAKLVRTLRTDARGRDSVALDSLGHTVQSLYESAWGNVLKVIDPTGVETRFSYSSRGLRDTTVVPLAGKSYVTYGTMNQVLTQGIVLAGTGTGRAVASYAYHPDLSLWTVTTPRPETGNPVQYSYSYNAAGWLVYQGDPAGTGLLETFKYDLAGNLRTRINRNGKTVQMTYDPVGRLLSRSGPDFPTDNFKYDSLGRFEVAWNAEARDSTSYDTRGRLAGWTQTIARTGKTYTGGYNYDAFDRVTRQSLFSTNPAINSAVAYVYANGTGRRDSLCAFAVAGNQGCVTFKRNADGGADTLVFNRGTGNVWRLYQGYDASHRVTAQDYDLAGLAPFDLTQTFDSLGRVRSRTSPKGGSYTRRVFRYDSLGFLRNVCDSLGSQCQNTVNGGTTGDAWSYDSTGNRTEVGTSDTYGPGNRLTARSTYALAYDSTGSLVCHRAGSCPGTTSAGSKYGWDALGRLREIRNAATGALVDSFAYDALNRRLLKMKGAGGTEYYVYAGSQVILDVDSTGAVLREYAWYPGAVDRLFAVRTPSDTFAAVLDPQTGSVRGLARFRTGGRVKEYAERPWGDVAADTGLVLRYRFAGREFDQESGLYYMRARYYDPAVGRWISEDPIGAEGGLNLYAYAANDPINRTDGTGLASWVDDQGRRCTEMANVTFYTRDGEVIGYRVNETWVECEGTSGSQSPGSSASGSPSPECAKARFAFTVALTSDIATVGTLVTGVGFMVKGGQLSSLAISELRHIVPSVRAMGQATVEASRAAMDRGSRIVFGAAGGYASGQANSIAGAFSAGGDLDLRTLVPGWNAAIAYEHMKEACSASQE